MEFFLCAIIIIVVVLLRDNPGDKPYKYVITQVADAYNKYAPYSFKTVSDQVKKMGLNYTVKDYTVQVIIFSLAAFIISYLYFYSIFISIIYIGAVILIVPYLAYLRYQRIYSEFIFEQIQTYTTNVIMEFMTTESFVKSLEGVYESGILEEPVAGDVKMMINLAYQHGDIKHALDFMNKKHDYYIIKNMHQLFYQVTTEGSKDAKESLEAMLVDIDMLVESVYRDRMDRANFHKAFIRYGIMLYLMVMLIQYLLGIDTYLEMVKMGIVQFLLHAVVIINTGFLLGGEKYYNQNVGAE